MSRFGVRSRAGVLVGFGLLGTGFLWGLLTHRNRVFPYAVIAYAYARVRVASSGAEPASEQPPPPGMWVRAAGAEAEGGGLSPEQRAELERVSALGYLSGYRTAPGQTGTVLSDSARSYPGYNFYTSGHAPEAILMDMQGTVLHTWRYPPWYEWHDEPPVRWASDGAYWRRAHLLPNGDVLAIYDGLGLIKVDKDGTLLWAYDGRAHHDLDLVDDGSIYLLTRELDTRYPDVLEGRPVVEDYVVVLDQGGNVVRRVSILKSLINSEYASYLDLATREDLFHTNSVEVLDGRLAGRSPAFKAGNVLVCLRNIDAIAVLDIELESVVWALRGMWKMPHDPTVLENGNMLLFDNQGHRDFSKVIEFDPFTQDLLWAYKGDEMNRFRSSILGASQRLPNGNTLITESLGGRAFEVTRENEIVWEFVNPRRAGTQGELIAVLPAMLRLSAGFPLDWLQ
jgi:hypothetical protein